VDPEPVRWRSLALPAYGPTLLVAIGYGAVLPLVALSARELEASVGQAALVVALMGLGQLVGDLPAGALAARVGEKRALVGACLVDAAALLAAFAAPNLHALAVAVFVTGLAGAVFGLARQAYLTAAIPAWVRARAMSTLGGTLRLGSFLGPLVGAVLVWRADLGWAYVFAASTSLAAAGLVALLPDLPGQTPGVGPHPPTPQRRVWSVLQEHRQVLLTVGTGVLLISAARATRQSLLPLWADSQGLDASATSLIFAVSSGLDLLLFYPGGAVMDRYGRVFVAVPTMVVLGLGFLLLPLTATASTIALVAALMGLGNGFSAGIVMTLGADASPYEARAQFLAGWRLFSDLGQAGGPLLVSAVALAATLGAAAVVLGVTSWLGAAWLARWLPASPVHSPVRRGLGSATEP